MTGQPTKRTESYLEPDEVHRVETTRRELFNDQLEALRGTIEREVVQEPHDDNHVRVR